MQTLFPFASAQNQALKQHTVHDNAMAPAFPCGTIVLARKANSDVFIEWGEAYLLETPDGTILTRLAPGGKDEDKYHCVRDNSQQYPSFDVPKWAVLGFYRVIGAARFM